MQTTRPRILDGAVVSNVIACCGWYKQGFPKNLVATPPVPSISEALQAMTDIVLQHSPHSRHHWQTGELSRSQLCRLEGPGRTLYTDWIKNLKQDDLVACCLLPLGPLHTWSRLQALDFLLDTMGRQALAKSSHSTVKSSLPPHFSLIS